MKELILIMVSLLLGFWQGIKKRNKKNEQIIYELKTTISDLQYNLRKLERKNGNLIANKKNLKLLETDLLDYINNDESHKDILSNSYYFIDYVMREIASDELRYQLFDFEIFNELIEGLFDDVSDIIIIEYSTSIAECYQQCKLFLEDIDIEKYSVTYDELLNTIYLVALEKKNIGQKIAACQN